MSLLRICLVSLVFSPYNTNTITLTSYHLYNKNKTEQSFINNDLLNFNKNYLSDFNLNQPNTILSVNINTSNLNTSSNIYYANMYSGVFFFTPVKWIYHFTTNISNPNITYNINFNKINYFNNYTNNINLTQLINLNLNVNDFISNFLNNAVIKIPDLLLHACNWYQTIGDFLSLNNQFNFANPQFNFKSFSNVKLFKTNSVINALSVFQNMLVTINKNNLFLDLNTSNLNLNQTYIVNNVSQLDRYLASCGPYFQTWNPLYANSVNMSVNLSLKNILSNYYCINPKLLYNISTPSLLNNNQPYSTFPNLIITPNYNLLNDLFEANITSQLFNKLCSVLNNSTINVLMQTLWNKHAINWNLVNNILNLFNIQNWNYNPNINNLVINNSDIFPIDSLIELLKNAITNLTIANWYNSLNNFANTKLNLSQTNYINLYQQILLDYKNSNLKLSFNNQENSSINYQNNQMDYLLNQDWNYEIDLPYKYEYQINNIAYTNSFYTASWNPNINFSIFYYPSIININEINTSNIYTNKKINFFYLYQLNNINQVFLNEIAYSENSTLNNVLSQIKMFNNSLNNDVSLSKITKEFNSYLIDLDLIYSIYMLLNINESLYEFIISNMFYLNLFKNANNSLISDLCFVNNNLNTLSVTFNLNNRIQLVNNNYIKFTDYSFNSYSNKLNLDFYENKSNFINKISNTKPIIKKPKVISPKPKPKIINNTPIKKVVINKQNKKIIFPKSKTNLNTTTNKLIYLFILIPLFFIFIIIIYQIITWKIKLKIKK